MAISNNKTQLAKDTVQVMDDLRITILRARDITSRYFDTGVSTDVNALANASDTVPGTPFDKETLLGAITVLQQLIAFADNAPVAQNTYRVTINKAAALKGV